MPNRSDTFQRADNPATLGTPSDGGSGYVRYGSGTYGILFNLAYPSAPAGGDVIALESGLATNIRLTWKIAGAVTYSGYAFNVIDGSNFFRLLCEGVDMVLGKKVAGVETYYGGTTLQPVVDDILAVERDLDGTIRVYINNVLKITRSGDTDLLTATKHGLYTAAGSGAVRWGAFTVTDRAPPPPPSGAATLVGTFTQLQPRAELALATPPATLALRAIPATLSLVSSA